MAASSVTVQFDQMTSDLIRKWIKAYGSMEFLAAIDEFFSDRATRIAINISRSKLANQALKRRTGNLSTSVVGLAVRSNGLPAMRIGVLKGPALPYAAVQEYGTKGENPQSPFDTIRPVKAKALSIPVGRGLTAARNKRQITPREFAEATGKELEFVPFRRRTNVVGGLFIKDELERARKKAAKSASGRLDFSKLRAVFLLLKEVELKARYYLRDGFNEQLPALQRQLLNAISKIVQKGEAP